VRTLEQDYKNRESYYEIHTIFIDITAIYLMSAGLTAAQTEDELKRYFEGRRR